MPIQRGWGNNFPPWKKNQTNFKHVGPQAFQGSSIFERDTDGIFRAGLIK